MGIKKKIRKFIDNYNYKKEIPGLIIENKDSLTILLASPSYRDVSERSPFGSILSRSNLISSVT